MNTGVTSKEAILQVCREIVARDGLKALNMRSVAGKCRIALGTLYNYYSNKDELLLATVESVWKDIFHRKTDLGSDNRASFPRYVEAIFLSVRKGAEEYPDFFAAHSIVIAGPQKGKAKGMMEAYFVHIKQSMRKVLDADPDVDQSRFSDTFSKAEFLDFVLDHMILLLAEGKTDCRVLTEIIRRAICC